METQIPGHDGPVTEVADRSAVARSRAAEVLMKDGEPPCNDPLRFLKAAVDSETDDKRAVEVLAEAIFANPLDVFSGFGKRSLRKTAS
jgi:hypothetical protein